MSTPNLHSSRDSEATIVVVAVEIVMETSTEHSRKGHSAAAGVAVVVATDNVMTTTAEASRNLMGRKVMALQVAADSATETVAENATDTLRTATAALATQDSIKHSLTSFNSTGVDGSTTFEIILLTNTI